MNSKILPAGIPSNTQLYLVAIHAILFRNKTEVKMIERYG